jgi:hypothetical protein
MRNDGQKFYSTLPRLFDDYENEFVPIFEEFEALLTRAALPKLPCICLLLHPALSP